MDQRGGDGWMATLNAHEVEQTPGEGKGQGSLVCCSPWDCKESDTPERVNNNSVNFGDTHLQFTALPTPRLDTSLILRAHTAKV